MAIVFHCPGCEAPYQVKEEFAGRKTSCKKCGSSLLVPQILPQFKTAIGYRASIRPDASQPISIADRERSLLSAFQADLPCNRISLLYRLSILLVAVVMVLLPLVYVALIAAIGAGVVYHLTHHTGMMTVVRGRAAILALIAYAAPLVIGVIAVIFMVKPLFARQANVRRTRSLTHQGEPILFTFVERLAAAVGAPMPKQILVDSDVNASASFRRGWLSMLLGGDLALTIGVPLVAGLNARQFAGVLAHEFGHFRQGAGMRVSYIVRSISLWFTRVVYERDEWDVWLEHVADEMDFRIGWVFVVARGFVWLGRQVLWVLMLIGHAVAGVLLRQMEFDADRQQTRLAGSKCFESTMQRIYELSIASDKSIVDLLSMLGKGSFADNLPKLILLNTISMPVGVKTKLLVGIRESTSGVFDTHPAPRDRVAAALAEKTDGVLKLDGQAADLFLHFDALCTNITCDFYRDITRMHIAPDRMRPVDELIGSLEPSWSRQ